MALRRIKPAALHLVSEVVIHRPEILDHMPDSLPKMRDFLRAVRFAENAIDADYASWVARNWPEFGSLQEIEDLTDWVHRCRRPQGDHPIERLFTPSMSVRTVRELSGRWHEVVAHTIEQSSRLFPEPWFPAGSLNGGQGVVPITNSADLYLEGVAMHHCVGSYSNEVIAGRSQIYSVREGDRRIATFELVRANGRAELRQIRGICNAQVPKEIATAVRRWLASQKIRTSGPELGGLTP
jgi:hypothetical protein